MMRKWMRLKSKYFRNCVRNLILRRRWHSPTRNRVYRWIETNSAGPLEMDAPNFGWAHSARPLCVWPRCVWWLHPFLALWSHRFCPQTCDWPYRPCRNCPCQSHLEIQNRLVSPFEKKIRINDFFLLLRIYFNFIHWVIWEAQINFSCVFKMILEIEIYRHYSENFLIVFY